MWHHRKNSSQIFFFTKWAVFTTFTFNQCDLLDLPSMKNEKFKYRKCIYSKSHNVMCFNFLCGIKIRVTEFGCSFKVFLKFFC